MQDLIQETVAAIVIPPATYSSAHTVEWVNMEGHAKATFEIVTGATVTAGTKLKVQCATNAAGSSAANIVAPFDGGVYYKHTTTTVPTKTSASSSGSVDYIVIASTAATFRATVDASKLAVGKPYIALVAKGNSASSAVLSGTVTLWGQRYQQEAALDVLA